MDKATYLAANDNVYPFPGDPQAGSTDTNQSTSDPVAFEEECYERYRNRCVIKGFQSSYYEQCIGQMRKLCQWAKKPLIQVSEADFEAWAAHLARERGLAMATQRGYQSSIKSILNYLCEAPDIQAMAVQRFGKRIDRFAHEENTLIHRVEDESAASRRSFRDHEFEAFFNAIEGQIELAAHDDPRRYKSLCRDKALYYVMYHYGLRASEVGPLKLDSWRPNGTVPECGEYAVLHVIGKAARGSGKRHRTVPTTSLDVVRMIEWYRQDIRPLFKVAAGHEQRMFFSERGKGISPQSIQNRLKAHLKVAGLEHTGLSTHSLRHTAVTHDSMRSSGGFAQIRAGHKSAHTTELYTHLPPEHVQRHVQKQIRERLGRVVGQHSQKK